MKTALYIGSLLLSLLNLVAGLAVLIWRHTFSTRDTFQVINDFLFGVIWGPLTAAAIIILLLVAGCITETRPYAAVAAFALNIVALVLVLIRIGPPSDVFEGVLFLPVLLALTGFAWIAYRGFAHLDKARNLD
jgi:hypothetical protein